MLIKNYQKIRPCVFVRNFVKNEPTLLAFSLLELVMNDAVAGLNLTRLAEIMLLHSCNVTPRPVNQMRLRVKKLAGE